MNHFLGHEIIVVTGLPCMQCNTEMPELEFYPNETIAALCPKCQNAAMKEDYGDIRNEPSQPPPAL